MHYSKQVLAFVSSAMPLCLTFFPKDKSFPTELTRPAGPEMDAMHRASSAYPRRWGGACGPFRIIL